MIMKSGAAIAAIIIFAACAFSFTGCGAGAKRFDMMGYFGTYSSIVVGNYGDVSEKADECAAKAEAFIAEAENAVSANIVTSDIARFNASGIGEKTEISEIAYRVLSIAAEMYEKTGGYYNPAVGNLVDLWGFSPRFNDPDYVPSEPYDRETPSVPADEYVEAFSSADMVDFGAVELSESGNRYYIKKPDASVTVGGKTYTMNIDLGGIGKGYVADVIAAMLDEYGLDKSYVSVGTSSLYLFESAESAKSAPGKNMYEVSLAHPRGSGEYLSVYAKNTAGSTSGDYERCFISDGVRYSHLINPFDGRPTDSGFVTGSVFGKSAAEGDALTTALAVMEKSAALAAAEKSGYKYALLYSENGGYVLYTNMDDGEYALHDENVSIAGENKVD